MRRGARPQQAQRNTASSAAVPSSGHIVISNLDFQVSDGDLQVRPVMSCLCHALPPCVDFARTGVV